MDISSSSAPGQEERRDHALHAEKLHTSIGIVHDVENNKILPYNRTTLNCKPIHLNEPLMRTDAKYSSYELECLAIVNSLKRFYVYLHGLKFKILTYCDSLRLTLIEHRPGNRMAHVDALSRAHVLILEENAFEQILGLKQTTDPKIKEIKEQLLIKEMPFYELRNGMVFRKDKKKLTFYVPEEMGVEKVTEYIRETYWFSNMKEKYGPREGLLHNIDKGNKPFNTLHIDHLGPLEKAKQYHRHILVTIDAFSKFIKLFPCKGTTSCETVIHLQHYFTMYSRPQRIISDRGTCFTSAEFKRFIDGNNIKHTLIATGVPRANGQIEVINRIITPMLAKLCTDKKNWNKMLHEVEFALNNTVNSSTKETPSKLLFGVPQTGLVSDELRQILLDSYGNERNLKEARNEAEENIKKQQEYSKAYYDGKHKDALTYQIGDHVVIKNFDNTPGVNKKLIPKFK
ncbi:hypothetical protein Trydic_g11738 [Trypoxylus dichotomus]